MPSRSSAPKLNLEVVVSTALAVLDKDGLGAVTTRRVAQELGTGPASLYAHVRNKDELLSLVLDKVLADIPLPTARGTWQQRLLRYGRQTRKALLAHPGIAAVAMALPPTGAAAWAQQEWLRSLLAAAGLPEDQLQAAVQSISLYVIAGAHEEELFAGTDRSSGVAQRLEYGLRLMVHGLEHQVQQHLEHLQQHNQGS